MTAMDKWLTRSLSLSLGFPALWSVEHGWMITGLMCSFWAGLLWEAAHP